MERFLSVLIVIGVTLACHPVPEPKKHGFGNHTSDVTLVTQARYDPNLIQHFMNTSHRWMSLIGWTISRSQSR
ncbi:hypothetical protein OSTOST_16528 [Ostertagia ostertagi]